MLHRQWWGRSQIKHSLNKIKLKWERRGKIVNQGVNLLPEPTRITIVFQPFPLVAYWLK